MKNLIIFYYNTLNNGSGVINAFSLIHALKILDDLYRITNSEYSGDYGFVEDHNGNRKYLYAEAA